MFSAMAEAHAWRIPEEHAAFRGALRAFSSALDAYAAHFHFEDAAYWYGASTTLGVLAGAFARAPGALVLGDYTKARPASGAGGFGDADLWLRLAATEYVIAVEEAWPETPASLGSDVKARLRRARTRLGTSTGHDADFTLALVFVAPFCAAERVARDHDAWARAALETSADLVAWHFARADRTPQSERTHRWYPGVLVFGALTPTEVTGLR